MKMTERKMTERKHQASVRSHMRVCNYAYLCNIRACGCVCVRTCVRTSILKCACLVKGRAANQRELRAHVHTKRVQDNSCVYTGHTLKRGCVCCVYVCVCALCVCIQVPVRVC